MLLGGTGRQLANLVTYLAVEPGDNLTVVDTFDISESRPTPTISSPTSLTPTSIPLGNCSGSLTRGCYLDGLFPVLALSSTPAAYAFKKGLSIETSDGGPLHVDMSSATAHTDEGTQNIAAKNVPSNLDGFSPQYAYSEVANGVPFTQAQSAYFAGDSAVYSEPFTTHPSYPDFVQSEISITSGHSYWALARRTATPSGSETFDLSTLPPLLVSAGIEVGASTATIAWSTTGSIPGAAGSIVGFFGNYTSWTFVVPPGVSALHASATPQVLSTIVSDYYGTPIPNWSIAVISGSAIPDYKTLRTVAGPMVAMLPNPAYSGEPVAIDSVAMVPPLPDDGDVIISGYFQGS
jgi:hypothetical protein